MKNATTLSPALCLALAFLGCGGGGDDGDGGNVPPNPDPECKGTNIQVAEKNDYQFSSTLTFPPIKVQPKTELSFDWGDITKDFLGHPVDVKKDITLVQVLSWGLPLAELESQLNADTLLQSAMNGLPLTLTTDGSTAGVAAGATSAKTLQFTLNGTPIEDGTSVNPELVLGYFDADNYPPDYTTYTLIAASGNTPGQGSRMIQSFLLDKGSSNTEVKMSTSSTKLTWSANLHSLTPTGVPAGVGSINVDWTDSISTNALGAKFEPTNISHVIVGHYNESVAELEKKFLDIEIIPTELYQGDVIIGSSIDLSTLTDKDGKTFPGVDSSGTWLLALQCSLLCRNPAPWYLTILVPMDGCS